MSIVMKPDFRNSSTSFICVVSWFTKGTAMFAAAKLCECTVPSAWRPGSFDFTDAMWQSTQVEVLAG